MFRKAYRYFNPVFFSSKMHVAVTLKITSPIYVFVSLPLPVSLAVCLSVNLSVHLYVYLYVYLSVFGLQATQASHF